MSVAFLSAKRSKDPSTQVGACLVSAENKIVGIGYNGFPWGCSDESLPWAREADQWLDTKYPYVCHAEMMEAPSWSDSNGFKPRIKTTD